MEKSWRTFEETMEKHWKKVGEVGKATSEFMQSELANEQFVVENELQGERQIVVTDAMSRVASQFHAVHNDMCTMITSRKPRCTCDAQLECETQILHHVSRLLSPLFMKPEQENPTVTGTFQTQIEKCLFVCVRESFDC